MNKSDGTLFQKKKKKKSDGTLGCFLQMEAIDHGFS